jgi:ankyrin repeat protein
MIRDDSEIRIIDVVSIGATKDVQELLKKGLDPNIPDEFGNYAIIVAAERNDIDTFKVLKEGGANLHKINDDGHSALTWAEANQNNEMINLINSVPKHDYRRPKN